jgi:hypothetical protein
MVSLGCAGMPLTLAGAEAAFTLTAGRNTCEFSVPPTEITSGALDGERIELKDGYEVPAPPLLPAAAQTTAPVLAAASKAAATGSLAASDSAGAPQDVVMTSMPSVTASSTAWIID